MGFNFGAFAGGLAQGGMNTYQMLESNESQKKRDALIEMQAQQMRQENDQQRRLDAAYANTQGLVGQTND